MVAAQQLLNDAEQLMHAVASRQLVADEADPLVSILIALTGAVIGLAYELGVPPTPQAGTPTNPASQAPPMGAPAS